MKRRNFIINFTSAALLSLGGVGAYQYYRQNLYQTKLQPLENIVFLNDDDCHLLEILIPVFLFKIDTKNNASLQQVIVNIDSAIAHLPKKTQKEIRELFDLLSSMFGRLLLANIWLDWPSASKVSINQFLLNWRNSSIDLLQIAYRGLHKLILGSYYAEHASWEEVGYPGPPQLSSN